MILVDANLLIYAYNLSSSLQEPARRWLEGVFSESESVGISWTSALAFLRITTSPKAFTNPFTIEEATSEAPTDPRETLASIQSSRASRHGCASGSPGHRAHGHALHHRF